MKNRRFLIKFGGFFFASFVFLSASFASAKLAIVSSVVLLREHCSGTPCSPLLKLSFRVRSGGSCHTYKAALKNNYKFVFLTITDELLPQCTRPEQKNYLVELILAEGPFQHGTEFKLINSQYIMETWAP